MLVLSRRTNEKVVIPTINTSIQVVSIKPGVVRLGLEAPPHIGVFREEVLVRSGNPEPALPPPESAGLRQLSHLVRNRLNATTIGLALLRRQLQVGLAGEAVPTLDRIDTEIVALEKQIADITENNTRKLAPPRRALVVEDDRNECELLAGFLRLAGLEVSTAGDGADALDYLRTRERPDVVLLDMGMPRCDGVSTVRAIRGDPSFSDLKILVVSGSCPEQFNLGNGSKGVDGWFRKPLDPEALLRHLQQEWHAQG